MQRGAGDRGSTKRSRGCQETGSGFFPGEIEGGPSSGLDLRVQGAALVFVLVLVLVCQPPKSKKYPSRPGQGIGSTAQKNWNQMEFNNLPVLFFFSEK